MAARSEHDTTAERVGAAISALRAIGPSSYRTGIALLTGRAADASSGSAPLLLT